MAFFDLYAGIALSAGALVANTPDLLSALMVRVFPAMIGLALIARGLMSLGAA